MDSVYIAIIGTCAVIVAVSLLLFPAFTIACIAALYVIVSIVQAARIARDNHRAKNAFTSRLL